MKKFVEMKTFVTVLLVFIFMYGHAQDPELVTQEKSLGSITVLKYNNEGTLLASGTEGDNSIKVWDAKSGRIVGVLTGHKSFIKDLSFSPDGNNLVSVDQQGSIFFWDINTWTFKDSLYYQYPVISLSYSYKGKYLLAGTENKKVLSFDLEKMDIAEELGEHNTEVTNISVDPSTGIWASGSSNGQVKVWEEYLGFIAEKKLHFRKLSGLKFIENGKTLLSSAGDGNIAFWDAHTLDKKNNFDAHNRPITSFDVNEKEGIIVTASLDKTIKVWNQNGTELKHTFDNSNIINPMSKINEPVQTLALSPDGKTLATSSFKEAFLTNEIKSKDNVIKVWDLERKDLYKVMEGKSTAVNTFAFHPQKNQLITLTSDRRVTLWDLNKAEKIWSDTLVEPKLHPIKLVEEDEKGGKLKKGIKKFFDGDLGVLDIKDEVEKQSVSAIKRAVREKSVVKFSHEANYLITAIIRDEIRLYKTHPEGNYKHLGYVRHDQEFVNDVITDQDEKHLFCLGSGAQAISVIDIETKKLVKKLDTPTPLGRFEHFFEGKSLNISPDGKYLVAGFVTGKIYVYDTQTHRLVFENEFPNDSEIKIVDGAFANFSKDGSKLMVNEYSGLNVFEVPSFKKIKDNDYNSHGEGVSLNKSADFGVFKEDDHLEFEYFSTGEIVKSFEFPMEWITHVALNKNNLLGVSLRNGEFKFIDPKSGDEIVTIVGEDENYIFKTAENYYKVSKNGHTLVTFRMGQSAYPFEQFDLKYNRPDKVLEALKCDDPYLIDLYQRAYEKRLKKLGVSINDLSNEVHVPEIKLKNRSAIPIFTKEDHLTLDLSAMDDKYELKKLNVWINNVPVFGSKGKEISGKKWSEKVKIPLGSGFNQIQISVENEKMSESLSEYVEVELTKKVKPNLYLLSIGTSEYKDSRYNLSYAAKDANDLVKLFSNENDIYESVQSKTLTNEQVVKDDFLALKEFIKDAKIDDVILIFIAGHGLLSTELDYYYATHNIDFAAPEGKGLEYSQIEYILENILTLKKILIMDTCHSGEVDKDEVSLDLESDEENQDDIAFRNVGPAIKENEKVSPSKMVKELFTDVRKGTGTTVISSAGGAEYAMESDQWKNGLFTYCLLNGLTNRTADLDKDGLITLSELQTYVKEKVSKLSHGRQVPTTRVQNYALDYTIW